MVGCECEVGSALDVGGLVTIVESQQLQKLPSFNEERLGAKRQGKF